MQDRSEKNIKFLLESRIYEIELNINYYYYYYLTISEKI